MAVPTTINTWAENLALSLLPNGTSATNSRRSKDLFIRRLKQHNYGRTNQFEVEERLEGLEEKCQILNRDEISDALRVRRYELKKHDEQWLPDVLDLFLHLSDDPLNISHRDSLYQGEIRAESPPLRWADIEAEDPFDHEDQVWREPEYSESSSDRDGAYHSSFNTSPTNDKRGIAEPDFDVNHSITNDLVSTVPDDTDQLEDLYSGQFWRSSESTVVVSEIQAVREVLSMLQGFPTPLYTSHSRTLRANPKYRIADLGPDASKATLEALGDIGLLAKSTRDGIPTRRDVSYLQVIQEYVESAAQAFGAFVSTIEKEILENSMKGGVVSVMALHQRIEAGARRLKAIDPLLKRLENEDPVGCLDVLFDSVSQAEVRNDSFAVGILTPIFLSVFEVYTKPIDLWIQEGKIDLEYERIFVTRNNGSRNKASIWNEWYTFEDSGPHRAPSFLTESAPRIFAAGKTTAFFRELSSPQSDDEQLTESLSDAVHEIYEATKSSLVPFAGVFGAMVDDHISHVLNTSASKLKFVLETSCGLQVILKALNYIYFAQDGVITNNIESRIFLQIDRCIETWNDRFLLADMLEEAYREVDCISAERITIKSQHTSSRSMENRRRSVRILESLAVQYVLPWPIANILVPSSLAIYRRVSVILSQIRRAKYSLERIAYFYVHNVPTKDDPSYQKFAQGLFFSLLAFVNLTYDHFTSCIIQPKTAAMRLKISGTVDEMIKVHDTYSRSLDSACLSSKSLKLLKDTVISILDLCIRFADLVSTSSSTTRKSSLDIEASSFRSARSRRQRRVADDDSSSDEANEDDFGEGYSTFMLEENTTVPEEMKKIKMQFGKHISFLVAGLRGASRTSKETGELFELLAERLDNTFQRRSISLG